MIPERRSVVFRQTRLNASATEAHPVPGPADMERNIKTLRLLLLPLGAVGAAWWSQRAGLSLPLALGVLAGTLGALHIGAMVLGFGLTFLGFTRSVRRRLDDAMETETVELVATPLSLELIAGGEHRQVPWAHVTVRPFGPGAVVVTVADDRPLIVQQEHLEVPLSEAEWSSFLDLLTRHART